MDLIDRYLSAIRWNLPRGVRADDVIAELRDVIASRIEEREAALDRPLTRSEISAVLRDFGHPLVVAAGYGERQWLIGPDLFPFYFFVLKVVLAISVAMSVLSAVVTDLSSDQPLVRTLAHAVGNGWWSLLANAGLVTLIFAVIERTGGLAGYLRQWKPENLPDPGDLRMKPRRAWESLFEVAVGIAFILWWIGAIRLPMAYSNVKGLTLTPDPIWTAMWTPVLALAIAWVVRDMVAWLRPRWKAARAILMVGTTAGALALLAVIHRAGHWVTPASTTIDAAKLARLDYSLNLSIRWAIVIAGVIWLAQCAQELWRLTRARPLPPFRI